MTKIRPVLLGLLMSSSFFAVSQPTDAPAVFAPGSGAEVGYAHGQAVFTFHQLTDPVEPEKKRPCEQSTKGRPVSLPFPIQHQQPQQPY